MGWLALPYIVSGFGVGLIVGMTGVGGGSLMTPLLVLLFGMHPAAAVGTDLLYASVSKACGTAVHHIGGAVVWRIVLLLACGSVPASFATVLILRGFDVDGGALDHLISQVLGYALLVTSVSLVLRRYVLELAGDLVLEERPALQTIVTILFGALLGVLVSITSVGAGAIGVTVLVLLYPKLSLVRIVATDIAHAVPLTLVAGIGHLAIGTVDLHLLVSLLVGSVPGIAFGSYLAPRVPERVLRLLLAIILASVGGRLAIA